MSLTRKEWFDLPKIDKFNVDFEKQNFDKQMALGLLNEVQEKWCDCCDNYKEEKCGCYFPKFKKQMIDKINEHFETEKDNTVNFKHFHLLADGTLKSWKKDDLIGYIHVLYHNWKNSDYNYNNVIDYAKKLQDENERLQSQLIEYQRVAKEKQERLDELEEQHMKLLSQWGKSDNPPLEFDELKADMWSWDNKEKEWLYITEVRIGEATGIKYFHYLGIYRNLRELKDLDMVFEENRFYRRQVD